MPNYRELEKQLSVGTRRPVAIAFVEKPPEGVRKIPGSEPSSCSFWRLAAEGQTFYTVPGDHYNCPIGSYTHNTPLPEERAHELSETLSLMGDLGYVKMEEVPRIFRLAEAPRVIVYAPLAETPADPAAVLFAGRPGGVMLLLEAALRAGVMSNLPLLARPTCMAIPAALASGVVASAGCIGNRVYTEIAEDELYVVVRGGDLERLAEELGTIRSANAQLAAYHQARRMQTAV